MCKRLCIGFGTFDKASAFISGQLHHCTPGVAAVDCVSVMQLAVVLQNSAFMLGQ